MNRPIVPANPMQLHGFGDADGSVIAHAGRYAREAVLAAFEMIGGVERMADWADKNPTEFYTRIFPKVITREIEVSAGAGIEEMLLKLDQRKALPPAQEHETVDADFTIDE